jgi:hypothetical protein
MSYRFLGARGPSLNYFYGFLMGNGRPPLFMPVRQFKRAPASFTAFIWLFKLSKLLPLLFSMSLLRGLSESIVSCLWRNQRIFIEAPRMCWKLGPQKAPRRKEILSFSICLPGKSVLCLSKPSDVIKIKNKLLIEKIRSCRV